MNAIVPCDLSFFYNFENKLALFTNRLSKGVDILLNKLMYPYISFDIIDQERDQILVFKNQKVMNDFKSELEYIRTFENEAGCLDMPKRHLLLGKYLGFPPKAVEYFSHEKYQMNGFSPINIAMYYYGLVFASYPETLEDDIRWLQNTYGKPFDRSMIDNLTEQLKMHEISV
ncbi:hypothetical protein QU593_10260 [Rossellomorea marisflavi]|uniref:hypothetical protein n=1 Tax=Rossellomorea marisflavi TaxID=189381 RepID=UPI0025B1167B|nr:hypothetical protein [Rossellomorea marisflavi]WJV20788.1 hypothetical protein QU593_10260 [Rossellomorea marisflavi]